MKLDMNRMAVFAAVVEQGSFTAAAERLSLTKSMVSQHVSRLEQELGAKLLIRTTRRLTLTEAGARYYQRCAEVVSLVNQANQELQGLTTKPAGVLRLTAPQVLGQSWLVPILSDFVRDNPGIRPVLICNDARLDLVSEAIDLAISVGALEDSSYRAQRIGGFDDVLCASRDYLAARAAPTRPEDLADLDYVGHMWGNLPKIRTLTAPDGKRHAIRLAPRIACNNLHAVKAFMLQGMGFGILPQIAAQPELDDGRLLRLLPDHHLQSGGIYAVHAYQQQAPLKVRAFIDYLKARSRGAAPKSAAPEIARAGYSSRPRARL